MPFKPPQSRRKNFSTIPYHNPQLLSVFMEEPKMKIAEVLTGALSIGKEETILIGGRLIQGVIKGNGMKQLGRELKKLMEKGRISEDYPNEKYGFQSLSDILNFIDSEAPDEERLNAVKALFISVISIDETEAEKILNYQLFQLMMKLSSSQILTLKICYEIKDDHGLMREAGGNFAKAWAKLIADRVGHGIQGLILNDEKVLMEHNLLTPRDGVAPEMIVANNARLSDLGLKLCEKLEKYAQDIAAVSVITNTK